MKPVAILDYETSSDTGLKPAANRCYLEESYKGLPGDLAVSYGDYKLIGTRARLYRTVY
jgi:hypothetical protein